MRNLKVEAGPLVLGYSVHPTIYEIWTEFDEGL